MKMFKETIVMFVALSMVCGAVSFADDALLEDLLRGLDDDPAVAEQDDEADLGLEDPAIEEPLPAEVADEPDEDDPEIDDLFLDDVDEVPDVVDEDPAVEELDDFDRDPDVLVDVDPENDVSADVLEQRRVVALRAQEEGARSKIQNAFDLLEQNRYEVGIRELNEGISNMPVRAATDEILSQARRRRAFAYVDWSKATLRRQDFDEARSRLAEAQRSLEPLEAELRARVQRDIDNVRDDLNRAEERYAEETSPEAMERRRIAEEKETIEDLIATGREMMRMGNIDRAERMFRRVLNLDPYHTGAMRLLRKVEDDRYRLSSLERRTTVSRMMQEVRDTWNPPVDVEVREPLDATITDERFTRTETQELRRRMEDIVIPSIEFRQANIVDVIDFLRDASEAADPEGVGVNIILRLQDAGLTSRPAEREREPTRRRDPVDDLWGDFEFDEPVADERPAGPSTVPTITLNLRRVTLMDAIQYVTEVANLKYRLERNVVIITPADVVEGQVITRMYPVQPSFLDVVVTRQEETQQRRAAGSGEFIRLGDAQTTMERADVKEFFENAGVRFPTGTSITYNPGISQLIVSNTPENLEVFESILAQLNVVPRQVEIETRFVEVAQTDLEEIGFEWLLNDNYEMLVRDGPGPVSSRPRIVMDRNSQIGGFTRGLRFWGGDGDGGLTRSSASEGALGGVGGILGISSVLTNPEVSMVLHALDRSGGTDLLSAPRVTTRSGVNAEIKVVREIIYPTQFRSDVQQLPTTDADGRRVDTRQIVVTPEGFETRETGVILNVTPTVGPDGYTIDLSMVPEVTELVDWIQYGTEEYNMPQPIFSKRTIATSIIIWDGQTVVMGGMIREQLSSFDDKIPLLGDLPLIGRFFRSKGEHSQKQNLLIFVTARLVDPAGNRIRRPGDDAAGFPGGMPQPQQPMQQPAS